MFNWFKNRFTKKKDEEQKEEIFAEKPEEPKEQFDEIKEEKTETFAYENEPKIADKKSKETFKEKNQEKTDIKIEEKHELKNRTEQIKKEIEKHDKTYDGEPEMADTKESAFTRFMKGVNKTRKNFTYAINSIFTGNDINEDFYEELEEIMVIGDIGVNTTMNIIDTLRERVIDKNIHKSNEAKDLLKEIILEFMNKNIDSNSLDLEPSPAILMMVGVNGVGKTTTCGKLAYQFKQEGKSVAIIAADTFRAAATEQLEVWGERAGVKVISQKEGADPAAVVYDGLDYSLRNNIDITIIDTAGRLHNKVNLMNELNKIRRIIDKKMPEAKLEVILAVDATTGQNALQQVKEFKEAAQVTGVSLNKLDGTAKGGVIIPIQYEEHIPVKIVGVGESIYDLQPFDSELFVNAIFE
ncbi:MAG: signal recognition particle-docking protein FtsY [Ezakiella sp.]|nr:signal recognition particle-docking protein FtsY [Ezakiella sp.]MDD7471554.1 signal recognition particle-docking protein FtsY [Bacillota bacterium]MDY3922790.1 signal recognition particle-docking protein FtsY [Ezakiella sp.]